MGPCHYKIPDCPDLIDRTGTLHTTERGCALVLQRDLQYWGLDDIGSMEPCCALKYFPELDVCQSEKDDEVDAKMKALEQAEEEDFGASQWGQWRSLVWRTIEYPWTSKLAQFLALFSLSMVIISTITFIISTAEELQEDKNGESDWPIVVMIIEFIDNFVVVFFSIEFVVRLILCPNKIKFIR